ncbi:uncharacterized protein BX663DRAFT_507649 [Cokeromyces recurvatus]|uniref:uncharacterized protein n=1 Tax=Cokeromyces recurvatus TaxID=90255 RepID=UPI00221F2E4E|nr:uncharacterized protein BX663DRAFT_507649 [Cokeromyces recurvatus]KAI7903157.1 hypothetical protein BX663DRAFT_507649 [Cokeromyces recurvatus]
MSTLPRLLFSRLPRYTQSTLVRNSLLRNNIHRMTTIRSVHNSPKEYNGIQSVAHHFKQQRHMPYFLEYLMWAVFGSEALHLIWLKMDYKEYKERSAHKIKLLEEIIKHIEQGEEIEESLKQEIKMVLMNNKHHKDDLHDLKDEIDDEYLNHLIASLEKQEQEKKENIDSNRLDTKNDHNESPTASTRGNKKDSKTHFFL